MPHYRVPISISNAEERRHVDQLDPLRRELYLSFWYRDLFWELYAFDLFSMSHGVEVRFPFLDWRLVSYVQSLPVSSLVQNGFTKSVLRDAMSDRLPAAITERRDKVGYARPVDDLVNGPLQEWIRAQVARPSYVAFPEFWNGRKLRAAASAKQWDRRTAVALWETCRRHWTLESWPKAVRERCVR